MSRWMTPSSGYDSVGRLKTPATAAFTMKVLKLFFPYNPSRECSVCRYLFDLSLSKAYLMGFR